MKCFGNKNTFAIEYRIKEPPDGIKPSWDDWGCIYFWVNGKNLFAFKNNKPADTYHWYLYFLVQWFCENLHFIMDENDFPANIRGENSLQINENFDAVLNQYDDESDEWLDMANIIFEWNSRHWILNAYGGSFLPNLYMRATRDKVEIQWENHDLWTQEQVELLYERGLEYVDRSDFFCSVSDFCKELLTFFETKKDLKKLRVSLEKAIKKYNL